MMKIDVEIISGCLVFKDPRRAGEHDKQAQWTLLPAVDPKGIIRASERAIVLSHINGSYSRTTIGVDLATCGQGALLRERRAAAMTNLRNLAQLRAELETHIRHSVGQAREAAGSWYDYSAPTWDEIGKALGVTKQAAASRYRDAEPSRT